MGKKKKDVKKITTAPKDFEKTFFNDEEIDQIVVEAWRRIYKLEPEQQYQVISKLMLSYNILNSKKIETNKK